MIKKINYFLQALVIYLFFLIGRILGINLSRKIFSLLFLIIGPLFKSKKIVSQNLEIFSPNMSKYEKNKIKREMWKNYGMTFIEYMFLNYFKKNNSHIKITGEDNLNNLFSENKPVIFVSGHFANFELMSIEITKKNINLATIYRPLNNFFLNPFMEYLRKKYICKNQIKKGINGVRDAIEFIKGGGSIALMIDQRVSEGIKSNLFSKKCYTTTIPAQFVKKFNCRVVPIYIERTNSNKFKLKIFTPIKFNQDDNIQKITDGLNLWLEDCISNNPSKWIWSHDRWK